MGRFYTDLIVKELSDTEDKLLAPLVFLSDGTLSVINVPRGFITDYASVPRIPLAYMLFGGKAKRAAVVHDYLYSIKHTPRKEADDVFLEAMEATGIPAWRRYPMYLAVRAGGWTRYVGNNSDVKGK